MAKISLFLSNLEMTQKLGEILGRRLPAGNVLLLEGDLGTGKTSLIQGLGKGLGISDAIVSPTFTLINEYHDGRVPLYHLDLYRLTPQQVDELYLETYWQGVEVPPGIVAIEWSERLLHRPSSYLFIKLNHQKGARQATLQTVGSVHTLDLEQVPLALRSTSA